MTVALMASCNLNDWIPLQLGHLLADPHVIQIQPNTRAQPQVYPFPANFPIAALIDDAASS